MSIFNGTGTGPIMDYPAYAVVVEFTEAPSVAFFVADMNANPGGDEVSLPLGPSPVMPAAFTGALGAVTGAGSSLIAAIEDWADGFDWSGYGTYDSVHIAEYVETGTNVTPA